MNKLLVSFILFSFIPATGICQRPPTAIQRGPIVTTHSPNFLQTEFITPAYLSVPKIELPVYRIEIIDNRFDDKLGFRPVYKYAPKEIRLMNTLPDAIKTIFASGIEPADTARKRKMIVAIQNCWITYYADSKFNFLKKSLVAKLEYNFECFTAIDTNYYPLKRMSGNLTMMFRDEVTSSILIDSMIHLLQNEISRLTIPEKENPKTLISETRMDNYILQKKAVVPNRFKRGMYASYDDFINQQVITDSVDIIPYKDYYNRYAIAANISIIKDGSAEPCNKCWGYFDGRYLFYNTGNGFFIRMLYARGQFVFADLQQLTYNTIKKSITSESIIGNTPYNIIKDYGRFLHILYQLNYEDGKLY
jgi:hypothetical protein